MQGKYDEGKEKGIRNEKIKTLKRMLKARIPAETISIATHFILDDVTDFQHDFQTEYMEDSKHNTVARKWSSGYFRISR